MAARHVAEMTKHNAPLACSCLLGHGLGVVEAIAALVNLKLGLKWEGLSPEHDGRDGPSHCARDSRSATHM